MTSPISNRSEKHNGYLIVSSARSLGRNAWTYTVDIQTPDGPWLPAIKDHDNTWDTAEAAIAEGMRVGRSIAGRRE